MDVIESHRLPGKVISIGNLEIGGTGKTPVVISIAQHLQSLGASPVILTRGYRSGLANGDSMTLLGECVLIKAKYTGTYRADEAKLQAITLGNVPVIVGADRVAAAKSYLASFDAPSHWLLDDGFQHLRIKRDLDIVLLDAKRPFASGHLLPLGRLREPRRSLKRCDSVLFTRAEGEFPQKKHLDYLDKLGIPHFACPFAQEMPVSPEGTYYVDPSKVYGLLTGIAKPEQFASQLAKNGLKIGKSLILPDHGWFTNQRDAILETFKDTPGIITTEKDYWRDPKFFSTLGIPYFTVPLKAQLPGPFLDILD